MISPPLVLVQVSEAARSLLADGSTPSDIDPTTGKGPEWGKAAPIGLLVIVLLIVACYFLARSFSKNLKRVPKSFDAAGAAESEMPAAEPGADSGAEPRADSGAESGVGAGAVGTPGPGVVATVTPSADAVTTVAMPGAVAPSPDDDGSTVSAVSAGADASARATPRSAKRRR